ncbi:MAG: prepilin-type N-terminal cleavage/methylation domain-containing protein [Pseudohongiella sp.]|nr:prepilin-type N-terminal cleavage/methylation domain-containing protein [Pseudohongiella sp.]
MIRVNIDKKITGFTIIEMIMVIVVVSIISSVVVSRLSDSNSFNGIILRDQIVSLARIAQQSSLGRAGVELTITPDAPLSNVLIEAKAGTTVIESAFVSMESLSLKGDVNTVSSCSVGGAIALSNAAPLRIGVGELGDLIDSGVVGASYPSSVSSAVRICINDDPAMSVCISPAGFAYTGDCDV